MKVQRHLGPGFRVSDHGRRVVREDARHGRQVADVAIDDAEERKDGGLVRGDRVEVAHKLPLRAHRQHDFTSVGGDHVSVLRIVPNALQFQHVIY